MTREELIDLIVMSIDDLPIERIHMVFIWAKAAREYYTGTLIDHADRKVMTVTRQEQEILTAYRTLEPKYRPSILKIMLDNQASQEEEHGKLVYHDGVIIMNEYRRGSGRRREHDT